MGACKIKFKREIRRDIWTLMDLEEPCPVGACEVGEQYFNVPAQDAKMQFFQVVISPFSLTATAHHALFAFASKSVHSSKVWPL